MPQQTDMKPTITAFRTSPDRGLGLARDMHARWALAEASVPYNTRLLTFQQLKSPEHKRLSPFGMIPTYEEGEGEGRLVLFETGAIVLHIASKWPESGLLPVEGGKRARVISWMFASVATVENVVVERANATISESKETWFEARMPLLEKRVRQRLADLEKWMEGKEWLEGEFGGGDIMMVLALRRLRTREILGDYPNLSKYVERGEAREGFQMAFAEQLRVWEDSQREGRQIGH